ncbi:fatty acid desaturase [Caballeronia sordidicola]|uniref:fatty acid desaturase n=1 Tax=Caballeronia sordidicola TaxID=196367 RepID=UPI000A3B1D99
MRLPARIISPIESLIWSIVLLVGGVAGSIIILNFHANIFWLILTIIPTVSGSRYVVATIIHHGVHNGVFKTERSNKILCEILSTVTVVQPFDSYKKFHVHEHHGREFSTLGDQDLVAIYTLGLRPGISVTHMKRILVWQCVNPVFHARYLFGRIRSNVLSVPKYRLAMTFFLVRVSCLTCLFIWMGNICHFHCAPAYGALSDLLLTSPGYRACVGLA